MNPISEHIAEHLHELRNRLIICFAAVIISSSVAYLFSRQIAEMFMAPLFAAAPTLASLVYTNLTEAFFSYLKISILVGMGVSFPILLYQTWRFVEPGLHKKEKRMGLRTVLFATGLFAAGVVFSFVVVLPEVLTFLMGFASENLQPMPKFGAYLTFVARSSLAFGLAFEIPFLMVAASRTGLVTKGYFVRQRMYAYLAILFVSFLLTVGDPVSSVLMALPLCGLYEIGVLIIRIFPGSEVSDP